MQEAPLRAYSDLFSQATNFSLAFARFSPRAFRSAELRLNGVELNDPQTNTAPWSALGSLLSIAQNRSESFGIPFSLSLEGISTLGGGERATIEPLDERVGGRAVAAVSNRTYTYRLQGAYTLHTKNGWGVMVDASRRWGRSLSTSGAWTDTWGAFVAAQKRFATGHSIQVTFMVAPSARATAAPATDEAFALSGTNLYNPSWGVWSGRERSSRVRENLEPMAIVNHTWRIDERHTLKNALFVRTGLARQGSLTWQNAPNPKPDYWAAMPSAQPTAELAKSVARAWREEINVRQIDYSLLSKVNMQNSPRAKYILQDKVREMSQVTLQSSIFGPQFSAGVSATVASSLNYKELSDLLGAQYWTDVDNFVEMDDDTKELTQNNLRQPDRQIRRGDRFGYNYTMNTFAATLWGAYRYSQGRWSVQVGASAKPKVDQRVGHYEKENFQSGRSFGASEPIFTFDLTTKAIATYAIGSRFSLDAAVGYQLSNKESQQLFISPTTRNALQSNISPYSILSAEVSAAYRWPTIRASASLFYTLTLDDWRTENLYNDLLHAYVHYSMRGINTVGYGLHGAAEFTLPANLALGVALALESNTYSTNPTAIAYRETTGEAMGESQTVLYKDLPTSLVPQAAGVISLSYRPFGWVVSLSAVGVAGSTALLSPIRRTYDALRMAASSAEMERMQSAERLPSSLTLDLFAGRTWYFATTAQSLGIYCGVNNLLNNQNIKSVGYESARLRNIGSSYKPSVVPHDTKYYHALGINFFVNLTYRF